MGVTRRFRDAPVAIWVTNLRVTYRAYSTGRRVGIAQRARGAQRGIRQVHALKGLSFRVHEGERVGIIGRNGSGKSTLMRALAGVTPPTSGAVRGKARPVLLGINAALIADVSGEKNVKLGCLAMGMTPAEADARYDSIVELSGLADYMDMPMSTYSSGMAARLRFAIAVSRSHEVLLIDEALSVGDWEFRQRSAARIKQMSEEAGTIFLVSHSMKTIRKTCTRVIWLDQGIIVMDGVPREVCDAYETGK